jgi:hypothetical protein
MERAINLDCTQHQDIYSCPDVLVQYLSKFDEYGIIIHDGGAATSEIGFCRWCGESLPESKRDAWFNALEELGFDDPAEQDIPAQFDSDAWHRDTLESADS